MWRKICVTNVVRLNVHFGYASNFLYLYLYSKMNSSNSSAAWVKIAKCYFPLIHLFLKIPPDFPLVWVIPWVALLYSFYISNWTHVIPSKQSIWNNFTQIQQFIIIIFLNLPPPPFLFSFLDRPNIYLFPHFPCFKLTSNNVRFYRDCIIRHYLTYVFSHLKVAVKKYQNHREVLRIGHANHN